jgi:curved DNA-binding protein CbpA
MCEEFPPDDLYEELGLSPRATPRLIEAAYRALAKEFHPDAASEPAGAEARMKRVNAAHDVLGDPGERARYDAWRASIADDRRGGYQPDTAREQPTTRREANQCPTCDKVYRTVAGLQWHRANVETCQ